MTGLTKNKMYIEKTAKLMCNKINLTNTIMIIFLHF